MDVVSIVAYTCLTIHTRGLKMPAAAMEDCMSINLLLSPMGRGNHQCPLSQEECRGVGLYRYRLIRLSCFLISSMGNVIDLVTACLESLIALSIEAPQEDR